ncbi:MAG: DUF4292 domain-containing protein [Saprospiraceae bacterium]|nr:DUF4292 domain-containing protein [Saprospiraceae bacterium]
MRKPFWGLFLLLFLGLSAKDSGCRSKSGAGANQEATEARSVSYLKKKLDPSVREGVQAMNAQAKLYIEGNGQTINATANLVWIRDSVIWLNVKKFGLEAARALITRDSVFLLNRLEKTYSAKGLESLQRQYSLPAGFELMQSLLLATPWYFPDMTLQSDIKDGDHRLSGANGSFAADYRMDAAAYRLTKEIFIQPRNAQTVSVSFDDYKKDAKAGWFPYLRTMEAFSPESGEMRISIEINELEVNEPKTYRFEIPKHYEKVD